MKYFDDNLLFNFSNNICNVSTFMIGNTQTAVAGNAIYTNPLHITLKLLLLRHKRHDSKWFNVLQRNSPTP